MPTSACGGRHSHQTAITVKKGVWELSLRVDACHPASLGGRGGRCGSLRVRAGQRPATGTSKEPVHHSGSLMSPTVTVQSVEKIGTKSRSEKGYRHREYAEPVPFFGSAPRRESSWPRWLRGVAKLRLPARVSKHTLTPVEIGGSPLPCTPCRSCPARNGAPPSALPDVVSLRGRGSPEPPRANLRSRRACRKPCCTRISRISRTWTCP